MEQVAIKPCWGWILSCMQFCSGQADLMMSHKLRHHQQDQLNPQLMREGISF